VSKLYGKSYNLIDAVSEGIKMEQLLACTALLVEQSMSINYHHGRRTSFVFLFSALMVGPHAQTSKKKNNHQLAPFNLCT
jgi:hypothetical protein